MKDKLQEHALSILIEANKRGCLDSSVKAKLVELVRPEIDTMIAYHTAQSDEEHSRIFKPEPTKAEIRKMVESLRLEDGYTDAMETQKCFQLLKAGEKTPYFDQVLNVFTPKMLTWAQKFQNPTLILRLKDRSFNDLISAMDGHKTMEEQGRVHVDEPYHEYADHKPDQWGAYIVDGEPEMETLFFDDTERTLNDRCKLYAEYKCVNGLSGMDRLKYAQLMMQSLKQGNPIDAEWTRTLLDEDPSFSITHAPNAFWHSTLNCPYFYWPQPGNDGFDDISLRLRRSAGGKVAI
jgi:hypothetical protein